MLGVAVLELAAAGRVVAQLGAEPALAQGLPSRSAATAYAYRHYLV